MVILEQNYTIGDSGSFVPTFAYVTNDPRHEQPIYRSHFGSRLSEVMLAGFMLAYFAPVPVGADGVRVPSILPAAWRRCCEG